MHESDDPRSDHPRPPEGALSEGEGGRAGEPAPETKAAAFNDVGPTPDPPDLVSGLRKVSEFIGFPLICPEPACRRGRRRCRAPEGSVRLPCLSAHYQPELRYILHGPIGLMNAISASVEALPEPEDTDAGEPALPPASRAREAAVGPPRPTLIERLFGNEPATLRRLRRPRGAPRPPDHATDRERFAAYFEAGNWREGRLPPVAEGTG